MAAQWHSLTVSQVLEHCATAAAGLSSSEAQARLERYGENAVPAAPPISLSKRFLRQFNNVLIYILLSAAIVTACMQHWTDTLVIISVVLINALIGFIQENKAEKALAAIRELLTATATVFRDGEPIAISATKLVLGDKISLTAGDKVPADIRLIDLYGLKIQESILTGESFDIEKNIAPKPEDSPLGERTCMAYSGTLVTAGQGTGIVIATSQATEIGQISTMVGQAEAPQTPLGAKLARFSQWLAAFIVLVSVLIFFYGVTIRHLPLNEMFMVMIGIAVSSIPEGLPAVISITMALGARAMSNRHAIVRHLPVIEALGSVTVICTDKTGTLTKNELAVTDIVTATHCFSVTGAGYAPDGRILFDNKEIELAMHPTLHDMSKAALLNNDATLSFKKGVWELNGDPTEGALITFARKAGHTPEQIRSAWPRADIIPFAAETRYMATLHHGDQGNVIYVKGAPEALLSMCHFQQDSEGREQPLHADYWNNHISVLAMQGKRVLAIARCNTSKNQTLNHNDIHTGLTFLGLFGIMDTPREEAKTAIASCIEAGIKIKMITGDHVLTASAIGKLLGIPHSEQVMTGSDVEQLSDEALADAVEDIGIYARMHPEHKLRLVKALQSKREVVAMTGDGVNDAPALKSADIGIAMGRQGTEVAKEASDLVLTDDNFASIAHAIEEGRNIYRNIKHTIQFMLVTDGAEGLTLLIAMLAGFTLPITPLQILWVNLVTAVTLSLAFAFAPHDSSVMRQSPLPLHAPIFSKQKIYSLLFHMGFIAAGTIGIFLYETRMNQDIDTARTMAINTLIFFQIFYLIIFFPRHSDQSTAWLRHYLPVILSTASVILFQVAFTYLPWMQAIFATAFLSLMDWLKVLIVSGSILVWIVGGRRFFS
jgi:magnesium-transporting ATPase (P-type)